MKKRIKSAQTNCTELHASYRKHGGTCYNYTGQQNLTFFLSHELQQMNLAVLFNAEFRYVNRIFLSGRVSMIQRNLNVQNSTLRAHETGRKVPLKRTGV
jgi:hypothetical protein